MTHEEFLEECQLKANAIGEEVKEVIKSSEKIRILAKKIIAARDKEIEKLKFKILQLEEENEYETEN